MTEDADMKNDQTVERSAGHVETLKKYEKINVPGEDAALDRITQALSDSRSSTGESTKSIDKTAVIALDAIIKTSELIRSEKYLALLKKSPATAQEIMNLACAVYSKMSFGLDQDVASDVITLEETLNYQSDRPNEKNSAQRICSMYETLLKEIYKNSKLLAHKTPDKHSDIILQTTIINQRLASGVTDIESLYIKLKSKYAQAMEQIRKSASKTSTLKNRISDIKNEINELPLNDKDKRIIVSIDESLQNALSYLQNNNFTEANNSFNRAFSKYNSLKAEIQSRAMSTKSKRNRIIATYAIPSIIAFLFILIASISFLSKRNRITNDAKQMLSNAMTSFAAAPRAPLDDQIQLWNTASDGFTSALELLTAHHIDAIAYDNSTYDAESLREYITKTKANAGKTETNIRSYRLIKEYGIFINDAEEIERSIENSELERRPELWARALSKYKLASVLIKDNPTIAFPIKTHPDIKADECDRLASEANNAIHIKDDVARFDILWNRYIDFNTKASAASTAMERKELLTQAYETLKTANEIYSARIKSPDRINGRLPVFAITETQRNIHLCEKEIALASYDAHWNAAEELENALGGVSDDKKYDQWKMIADQYQSAITIYNSAVLAPDDVNQRDSDARYRYAIERSEFFLAHKEISLAVNNANNALQTSSLLDEAVDALRSALKYSVSETDPVYSVIYEIIKRYEKSTKSQYDMASAQLFFLNNETITSLRPVELLINVKTLTARNCSSLTDISSVAYMKKLSDLRIDSCPNLIDLSPISSSATLTSLSLKLCNGFTDFQPIINSRSIVDLTVDRCDKLTDYSLIKRMTQLKSLTIIGNSAITSTSSISLPDAIESFTLDSCASISDIRSLEEKPQIIRLSLKGCRSITDFSPIQNMARLESLSLQSSKSLSSITVLLRLTQLRSLDLSHCENLRDISPVATLSALTSLNLMGCELIEDIQSLVNLKNLTSLDIRRCKRIKKDQIDRKSVV